MAVAIVGRPAKPLSDDVVEAAKRAVASVEGIAEAHFPQLYLPGQMQKPEQTLVIIPGVGRDIESVMECLMTAIRKELPHGPDFPAMPVLGSEGLAQDVRQAGCELFRSEDERPEAKKRWQFWK